MIPTWISTRSGETFLNDLRRYVKGGFLTCDPAFVPLVIPAAPAAAIPSNSPPIVVEGNEDALTEIFSAMGEHDAAVLAAVQNRMTVLITDISWRRRLMNREILVNHVFGTNLQPAFFSETTFLRGQQTLQLNFQNNSVAGATSFRFLFETRKFQATSFSRPQVTQHIAKEDRNKLFRTPFWLTSNAAVVAPAGGVIDAFFTVSRDVTMIIYANVATFISTGVAGDIVQGFAVEFFDAKTERPLQNQPIARSCCSGSAGFPFVDGTGWMVEPNTTIRVRFTNLITDQPTEIFWTFKGVASLTAVNPFEVAKPELAYATPLSRGAP